MRRRITELAAVGLLALLASVTADRVGAQPTRVSYQGHLQKNGVPFNGNAGFKFAILSGVQTLWSNDGTSVDGSQPTGSVTVLVEQGVFSVLLGEPPMVPVPAAALAGITEPTLRVWVDTGGGFEQLADQALASGAFALQSEGANRAFGNFVVAGEVQVGTGIRFPDNSVQTTAGGGGPDADWTIDGNDMYSAVSGNVGVGTQSPVTKLDVSGIGRADAWAIRGANGVVVGSLYLDGDGDGGILELSGPGGLDAPPFTLDTGLQLSGGLVNGGGQVQVRNGSGATTVEIDGDIGGGGLLGLTDGSQATLLLDGKDGAGGGLVTMTNTAHTMTVRVRGQAFANGSQLELFGSDGTVAHQWTAANREWKVFSPTGALKIWMIGDDGSGKSRVRTDILEITGGADLSERFDVGPAGETIEPGSVVCIDPESPGRLATSRRAHDRTVAGVVSGAGGVQTGVVMGQAGSRADGAVPVALTGRVWTRCDASYGAIRPGDLLTTSPRPGHAMRVSDPARSQGAILGKAMTALDEGTGLVLVLVALQ